MKINSTLLFIGALLCFGQLRAQDQKEWTIIAYVVGTDIVQDAITDLGEMKAAQPSNNVNIAVLRGGSNLSDWNSPTAVELFEGDEYDLNFTPPDSDMAGPANISAFIDYAVDEFPAQKYMLLFYNHGMDVRGFGWDETVDAQSSVSDLQDGIGGTNFIASGGKFEVIAFDACLMASFEVMSALRSYGNYYFASEEEEPWHAWNWTPIVNAMNTSTGLTGADLAPTIVDGFIQHSQANNTNHVTLSCVDLSRITALETSLEQLFARLDDDIYRANLIRARKDSEEYGKNISPPEISEDMVDIGDLVLHLRDLEPGIASEIDDVLAKLGDAVVYSRSDAALPHAQGISMFLPLRKLVDEDFTYDFINQYIAGIDYSSTIKSFVSNDYLTYAFSDDSPLSGIIDNDFSFAPATGSAPKGGTAFSALRIENEHEELDHVQVVLMEEIEGDPEDYILLGSTYADTSVVNEDGTVTYAYQWDEEWLGINGYPAYVADIQLVDVYDEEGNLDYEFYRLHIPAILNPGTEDEKEIQFTFHYDGDFNHELISIMRERYGDSVLVTSKDRIRLQPGDRVQLEYEIFNVETHEAEFVPEPGAIIEIENGNEDIDLQHIALPDGRYHLGFVVMDHFQNDTLIYDQTVYEVMTVETDDPVKETMAVTLTPNPATAVIQVRFAEAVNGTLELYDLTGRRLLQQPLRGAMDTQVDVRNLAGGTYLLKVRAGDRLWTQQIIKP